MGFVHINYHFMGLFNIKLPMVFVCIFPYQLAHIIVPPTMAEKLHGFPTWSFLPKGLDHSPN